MTGQMDTKVDAPVKTAEKTEGDTVQPEDVAAAIDEAGEKKEEKKVVKRKNPRFGRNSDGQLAEKAEKKVVVRKSRWGKFLADFKTANPGMCSQTATIEARKIYKPANGKNKSFERIYTEVWKQRNPHWTLMAKPERLTRIRDDFIKAI